VTALAAIIDVVRCLFGYFAGTRLSKRLLNRGYVRRAVGPIPSHAERARLRALAALEVRRGRTDGTALIARRRRAAALRRHVGWLGGDTNDLEWTFLIMLIPVIVARPAAFRCSQGRSSGLLSPTTRSGQRQGTFTAAID
jgi:hypothetical protein